MGSCNDVDGGRTTLTSPVFLLEDAFTATIVYDRWFSNELGADPRNDDWIVQVSNDTGITWTTVESTKEGEVGWVTREVDLNELFGKPDRVQIRFIVSDEGIDSTVEAAVDDVRVLARLRERNVVPYDEDPAPPALSLSAPARATGDARVEFVLPERGEIDLSVFDVRGRLVRRLAAGARESGDHAARWDGRNGAGEPAASGVYFFRLSAAGRSLTEKTVLVR